ncbi:hypothetical protein DMA11_16255 [Marinilabiliaceae bacterium JC017]|nr:hypothetical protein DMA11_16255 [Marinilabiliaceae bacterium JC017]
MIGSKLEKIVIGLLMVLGLTVFTFWLIYDPVKNFTRNIPGMDNRPKGEAGAGEAVQIGRHFQVYGEHSSVLTGKWSQFRGAQSDNISKENVRLISQWGQNGPKVEWQVDLGEGHAAPAVYNGMVYLLDYDEARKADALRCFSLETGAELWRRWYHVHVKRNHGMSRTVPAVNDKYIVTIGPKCQVMCVDRMSGDYLWGIDLVKEYNTEVPFWYTGQCPVIEDNVAIIAPGGTALLAGIDCATGKVIWETPNPDNWKMSHASVMPMTFGGKKMWVYAAVGGVCGISAEKDDAGTLLWKTAEFSPSVVAPSPVVMDDGKIFITAGYGAGGMLFRVKKQENGFSVQVLQKFKPREGMASEQQTPVFYAGRLFTILPKDAGARRNQFVCCHPDDCKKILWTSGKTDRFGLGPYMVADGKFFILRDDGTMAIARATTSRFELLDKVKLMDGHDAWGPLVITDGRLLMRDSKHMMCIDLRK